MYLGYVVITNSLLQGKTVFSSPSRLFAPSPLVPHTLTTVEIIEKVAFSRHSLCEIKSALMGFMDREKDSELLR